MMLRRPRLRRAMRRLATRRDVRRRTQAAGVGDVRHSRVRREWRSYLQRGGGDQDRKAKASTHGRAF
jgi:hypothetical protein